ncbi:MAG: hypothetical protein WA414_01720 [Acidobacteriaceae bacterium]
MRKTTVFGYSMQTRSARRRLVVALYASLALALIGGFFLDRLHVSGYYIYFAALFINWKILGGYGQDGLVKPFTGKGRRNQPMPSNLTELQLYAAGNLTSGFPDEYRNDERELQRRDRVHYQAYQWIAGLLAILWLLANWEMHPPHFIPAGLVALLLYLVVFPAILLAITLPQAILLWTEPDMGPDIDPEREPGTQDDQGGTALPTVH